MPPADVELIVKKLPSSAEDIFERYRTEMHDRIDTQVNEVFTDMSRYLAKLLITVGTFSFFAVLLFKL